MLKKILILSLIINSLSYAAKADCFSVGNKFVNAVRSQDIDLVTQMIEEGVDLDIQDKSGCTGLIVASTGGCAKLVSLLLFKGAKINFFSDTLFNDSSALNNACYCGHENCVKILIEAKADEFKITSLMWACRKNYLNIALLLIQGGADVNLINIHRFAALSWACGAGNANLVELLLKHGAQETINVQDCLGNTVLIIACKNENKIIVDLLISSGADINIKNKCGQSALDIAPHLFN